VYRRGKSTLKLLASLFIRTNFWWLWKDMAFARLERKSLTRSTKQRSSKIYTACKMKWWLCSQLSMNWSLGWFGRKLVMPKCFKDLNCKQVQLYG